MYKIGNKKSHDTFDSLPPEAIEIYEENIPALKARIAQGWDLKKNIILSEYTSMQPLILALTADRFSAVKLLVEAGAPLNEQGKYADKKFPSANTAARYSRSATLNYLVEHGALLTLNDPVGTSILEEALHSLNPMKIYETLEAMNFDFTKQGELLLRRCASNNQLDIVTFLLDRGVSVNAQVSDMICPYAPTAVTEAAFKGHVKMVEFLVERGADITLKDQFSRRPYTCASENGNIELAAWLRSREPVSFHSRDAKIKLLETQKAPIELVSLLEENRYVELPDSLDIPAISFRAIEELDTVKVGKETLVLLSEEVEDMSHLNIVWRKKGETIACWDLEHGEITNLGKPAKFFANMTKATNKLF